LPLLFTKADKLKPEELEENIKNYEEKMLETWEIMPVWFISSALKSEGRSEILQYIGEINQSAGKRD
jgi:GTP-binding protein